ncbi:hypothetical protein BH10ACT10_BH10ACT10_15240 [soil metagenome]
MTTPNRRAPRSARLATRVAAALVGTLAVSSVAAPAVAGPGPSDPPPVGNGELYLTSSTTTSIGQELFFAGEGFVDDGSGAFQKIFLKIDDRHYTGSANNPDLANSIAAVQVQADGTVSGSLEVPADIDDAAVNDNAGNDHWLRVLGSTPAVSAFSEDFEVDPGASIAPTVAATAATTTGRRSGVTVTVTGTGFTPDESVSVERSDGTAYEWTDGPTITADATGDLSGSLSFAIGDLRAGDYQLVLQRSSASATPAAAQVSVDPAISLSGLAVDSDGIATISNVPEGSTFTSVELDPNPAIEGDEVEIATAPFTADATGVAAGTVHVPAGQSIGTKNFRITRSLPYAGVLTTTAKVSPSSQVVGTGGFARVETDPGDIEQGLYQSAYGDSSGALFATTASFVTPSRLYKLNPDTLAVEASVVPPADPSSSTEGAVFAVYGIGVDDEHGTVWVTNTRQNTIAVYSQSDLSLIKQFPTGILSHTRDVVIDEEHDLAFVTSASEGSSGDGTIGVFTTGDTEDELSYADTVDLGPRTEFSPMSLELDEASGTLFTVSSTTPRAVAIDTDSLEKRYIELQEDAVSRGAGIAYDAVTDRLWVSSQNLDSVLIADATTGETVADVATGAQALNIAFDPVHRLAYVSNFGGSTVTVLDPDGDAVANLPHVRANHVVEDGHGSVYSVNKDADNTVVKLTPRVTAGAATVAGKPVVGSTVRATTDSWSPDTTFTYRWTRNGNEISGATTAAYRVSPADVGKRLAVTAAGSAEGFAPAEVTSQPTAKVAKGTLKSAEPRVAGKAKVGAKLRAITGTWTKGTKFSYTWLAQGKKIKGAKAKKLKVTRSLKGKKISVKVVGKKPGYTTQKVVSKPKRIKG